MQNLATLASNHAHAGSSDDEEDVTVFRFEVKAGSLDDVDEDEDVGMDVASSPLCSTVVREGKVAGTSWRPTEESRAHAAATSVWSAAVLALHASIYKYGKSREEKKGKTKKQCIGNDTIKACAMLANQGIEFPRTMTHHKIPVGMELTRT